MTIAESIFNAVKNLYLTGNRTFTRVQIRDYLQIDPQLWNSSYSPVFQGMRVDHPGGAPNVGEHFSRVFRQEYRGTYVLTEYGESLIQNHHESFVRRPPRPYAHPRPIFNKKNERFSEKIIDLTSNINTYHDVFYQRENFGHPCLYFHQKALETSQTNPLSRLHLEYVYATIVSWGMNRPGNNGGKMNRFSTFEASVQLLKPKIEEAMKFDVINMNEEKWKILEDIFKNIRIMESNTKLVGNSKTMHNLLPTIIPPVDRSYTLKYLYGNTNIHNDIDSEWNKLRQITEDFFIPIINNPVFVEHSKNWMTDKEQFPWDTSYFKIIDNLIIGAIKSPLKIS